MRYFLSFLFLSGFYLYGQTITNATSQNWSGGACCYSGTNYNLSFTLESIPKSIRLQKVYLRGHGEVSGKLKELDQINEKNYLAISFTTSSNQNGAFLPDEHTKVNTPEFKGTALIILLIDRREVKLIVDQFETLEHLAYP